MLLFKKRFLDAIRSGRKTQTIRIWPHCRLRAGQRSYIPGVGYICIESIDIVRVDELDEEDAQRDGFDSLPMLQAELTALYRDELHQGWQCYRIVFEVLSEAEQKSIRAEKTRRRQLKGEVKRRTSTPTKD